MKKRLQYYLRSGFGENIFQTSLLTGIVVITALLIFRILLVFSYNGEVGGIDNNFVYGVLRIIKGYDLYNDPTKFPFSVTIYSPLYYNICSIIGRILHINADEPIYVYRLCRSVSLMFDILTCVTFYFILKRGLSIKKELSWLSVSCFACILCLLGYTFSRCDSLAIFLYTITIYLLTNPITLTKKYTILILSTISVACVFSKQSGIILPLLICTWFLIEGNLKKIISYLVWFALIFLSTTLIYIYACNYHYLFTNTITGLQNKVDISWFYSNIFKRFLDSLWVLPVYFGSVIAIRSLAFPKSVDDKKWASIFIIQGLFSLLISLKWGSSTGYFYESFLLSFILILRAIQNHDTVDRINTKKIVAFILPLFILFFFHTVAQGYLFYIQKQSDKKQQYINQKEIRNYLKPELQENYVLDIGNENANFFKTLFYREMAVPNYDIVDCCTLPDKTFDYSGLRKDLSNGKIAYILAPENIKLIDLWGVSLKNFYKDTTLTGITIYHFKNPDKVE